jgi:hypothetical protein
MRGKYMKQLKTLLAAVSLFGALVGNAAATLTITDVSMTSNSLSFTLDGDLSGYVAPTSNAHQFGIQYVGNFVTSGTYTPNSWSNSFFDNRTFNDQGNTGLWDSATYYSWTWQSSDLSSAVATNRHITLTGPSFDTNAVGHINFVWGWANTRGNPTVIASFNLPAVPEPETFGMLFAGLALVSFVARRKQK